MSQALSHETAVIPLIHKVNQSILDAGSGFDRLERINPIPDWPCLNYRAKAVSYGSHEGLYVDPR